MENSLRLNLVISPQLQCESLSSWPRHRNIASVLSDLKIYDEVMLPKRGREDHDGALESLEKGRFSAQTQ